MEKSHVSGVAENVESSATPIERVQVSAYTVPTDYPESDGTLEWNKTTMVVVEVSAGGGSGIGYTYADVACAELIHKKLSELVKGENAMSPQAAWRKMQHETRNLGRLGLVAMGISAVDAALWDLKARLMDVPLCVLLGAVRKSVPIYGSGGFTSYPIPKLQEQLAGWASQGIPEMKMKVGREAAADIERVHAAREAVGPETRLFVDANGAYSRKQALSQAEKFANHDVCWFEEPVAADDLEGLHLIRERAPAGMDVAAGEYGFGLPYFHRMLQHGAVDVLQADVTRCAGVTGFLQAASVSEAYHIPFSAHTSPAQHVHACCAVMSFRNLEFFHDHVRIERMFFEGFPEIENGALKPDLSRPGSGLEFKRSDAKPYSV
jgi:L-alanine-DL-glutamate epimerase-like enolase superfamily enzyme